MVMLAAMEGQNSKPLGCQISQYSPSKGHGKPLTAFLNAPVAERYTQPIWNWLAFYAVRVRVPAGAFIFITPHLTLNVK